MTPKRKNLIFIFLILAMVLIYIFSGGSVGISLDFGEEALQLSASDYDWVIPYDRIETLEVAALPDAGTPTEGIDQRSLRCGSWKNDIWGDYTLCVNPKIDRCIVITMDDGTTYVLNYENRESTEQLYTMFTGLLRSKGHPTESE